MASRRFRPGDVVRTRRQLIGPFVDLSVQLVDNGGHPQSPRVVWEVEPHVLGIVEQVEPDGLLHIWTPAAPGSYRAAPADVVTEGRITIIDPVNIDVRVGRRHRRISQPWLAVLDDNRRQRAALAVWFLETAGRDWDDQLILFMTE